MCKIFARVFLFGLFSVISLNANSGQVTAYVTGTGTYDDGAIYVFFDRAISVCGDKNRIDLAANHSANKNVLSIAMTAFTAGKPVRISAGSCDNTTPVFGAAGDSYFYLTNEAP